MRNNMEAVYAYDGLFKIPFHYVPVRLIHVYGYIFHIIKLVFIDLIQVITKKVLSSAWLHIKDLLVIEVIEDAGVFRVLITVDLGIDFIDTDGFRERLSGDVGMIIKDSGDCLHGDSSKSTYSLKSHLGALEQFHDPEDHLVGDLLIIRNDTGLV